MPRTKRYISARVVNLVLAPEKSIGAAGRHSTDKPVVAHPAIGRPVRNAGPQLGKAPLVTVAAAAFKRDRGRRKYSPSRPLPTLSYLCALFVLATSWCTVRIQLIKFLT